MTCTSDCIDILNQITNLKDKLNLFINGSADLHIPTDAGSVKTLSGIAKTLSQSQYMQKIIDKPSVVDMNIVAPSLSVGVIVRVFNDPNSLLNGLYQKNDLGSMIKIDYTALNDLWQQLPNPYNFKVITLNALATTLPVVLASFAVPKASIIAMNTFDITYDYSIASPSKTGFQGTAKVSLYTSDNIEKASILSNDCTKADLTATVFAGDNPSISVSITENATEYVGNITFNPAKTGLVYHSGDLVLHWYNADNIILDFLV